jgi:hypothetical protein
MSRSAHSFFRNAGQRFDITHIYCVFYTYTLLYVLLLALRGSEI